MQRSPDMPFIKTTVTEFQALLQSLSTWPGVSVDTCTMVHNGGYFWMTVDTLETASRIEQSLRDKGFEFNRDGLSSDMKTQRLHLSLRLALPRERPSFLQQNRNLTEICTDALCQT